MLMCFLMALEVIRYQSDIVSVLVMIILLLNHILGWTNVLTDAVKLTWTMGYFFLLL